MNLFFNKTYYYIINRYLQLISFQNIENLYKYMIDIYGKFNCISFLLFTNSFIINNYFIFADDKIDKSMNINSLYR